MLRLCGLIIAACGLDHDAAVLLPQWLEHDPEGLPSLLGVQPITNGWSRHIVGVRYVLTVEAAQGLRDALAASQAATGAQA